MNYNEKNKVEKVEALQLIGSQMNFSLRSNQISVFGSPSGRKSRPHSAVLPSGNKSERKIRSKRPKSAEESAFSKSATHSQWPCKLADFKAEDKSSILTSYTDSSSRLLQALLSSDDNPKVETTSKSKQCGRNSKESPKISPRRRLENYRTELTEMINHNQLPTSEVIQINSLLYETSGEKSTTNQILLKETANYSLQCAEELHKSSVCDTQTRKLVNCGTEVTETTNYNQQEYLVNSEIVEESSVMHISSRQVPLHVSYRQKLEKTVDQNQLLQLTEEILESSSNLDPVQNYRKEYTATMDRNQFRAEFLQNSPAVNDTPIPKSTSEIYGKENAEAIALQYTERPQSALSCDSFRMIHLLSNYKNECTEQMDQNTFPQTTEILQNSFAMDDIPRITSPLHHTQFLQCTEGSQNTLINDSPKTKRLHSNYRTEQTDENRLLQCSEVLKNSSVMKAVRRPNSSSGVYRKENTDSVIQNERQPSQCTEISQNVLNYSSPRPKCLYSDYKKKYTETINQNHLVQHTEANESSSLVNESGICGKENTEAIVQNQEKCLQWTERSQNASMNDSPKTEPGKMVNYKQHPVQCTEIHRDDSLMCYSELKKENLKSSKVQQWIPENMEKSVRFTEEKHKCISDETMHQQRTSNGHSQHRGHHFHFCCRHRRYLAKGDSGERTKEQERDAEVVPVREGKDHAISDGEGRAGTLQKWLSVVEPEEGSKNSSNYKNEEMTSKQSSSSLDSSTTQKDNAHESDTSTLGSSDTKGATRNKFTESSEEKTLPEKLCNDSTYEEIVHLLQTLEEEDSEPLTGDNNKEVVAADSLLTLEYTEDKIDRLNEVYSYLEEVEKDSELLDQTVVRNVEKNILPCSKGFSSPRLDELLDKNSVELAHEVLTLKIQIEDQKKGIKLLRDTLAEMKEANQTRELAHQEELHKASAEAEGLVQRHQKFIKQLLSEKKKLNETVSKLVEDLKTGEERHKRNMKAVEEKHLVEIKRVKEAQAVADKLKREKWMEAKTQKIKEMTVKGLEPELSRMAAAQQQEMLDLRNLHRAELEAVELRAARRTSELMDQLRGELTKEKENAIERETEALRVKMEKQFDEERNKMEKYTQKLKDEIRRGEDRLSNHEMEFQQRLLDCRKEGEREKQRLAEDFQEKMEENRRRHTAELKNLRESLETEKEVWMNNYKKQQTSKFLEREAELHQQYKKERDRDIEVIIETLEKESSQSQLELKEAAENKLKRLKEKLESELKEVEASEALLKSKLSEAKSQVLEKEDTIVELNSQIRQSQAEISFLKQSCENMTSERANLKEIIRKEFEMSLNEMVKEKENVEKEMSCLKETHLKELAVKDQVNARAKIEMQKELSKVYARIKTAVCKKEQVIESLREENRAVMQRCQQLELMLDRQRRNLLLQ